MKAVSFSELAVNDVFTDMQGSIFIKVNSCKYACNTEDLSGNPYHFASKIMVLKYEQEEED